MVPKRDNRTRYRIRRGVSCVPPEYQGGKTGLVTLGHGAYPCTLQFDDGTYVGVTPEDLEEVPTKPDTRLGTITQFVADFFCEHDDLDRTDLKGDVPWNDYVGLVAAAGGLLEDVVQNRIANGGQVAEWYDILDRSTAVFRELLLAAGGEPDRDQLWDAFGKIVDEHLEK
jgi:hypothetical protein